MRTLFTQSCPTCGRKMRITLKLLGETVGCGHCRANFVANDDTPKGDRAEVLLLRAGQLVLAQCVVSATTVRYNLRVVTVF
jgi:hypothetical protein